MPMYGTGYIFSKPFFTGWVTVGIIWIFFSLGAVGIFPVFQSRAPLYNTFRFSFLDVTGKKHPQTIPAETQPAVTPGDVTPTEKKDAPVKEEAAITQ